MERTLLSVKEAPWEEFALEEFRALNEEILERVRRQNTFVGFSLIIAAALIPAINLWNSATQATIVNLVVSFILWVVLLVYIEQDYQVALIGNYILERVYPLYKIHELGYNPCWEIYRGQKLRTLGIGIRFSMSAKYAFIVVPMIFIDLGIIPAIGSELIRTFGNLNWIVIGYSLITIVKYFLTYLAFHETIKEYFRSSNIKNNNLSNDPK